MGSGVAKMYPRLVIVGPGAIKMCLGLVIGDSRQLRGSFYLSRACHSGSLAVEMSLGFVLVGPRTVNVCLGFVIMDYWTVKMCLGLV